MASEAKREAARLVAWLIKRQLMDSPELPGVRAELARLKEAFERVAMAADEPKPEGWSEGDPPIGACSCNECVDRKTKAAKEAGKLKDPTVCERCHNTGFETVPMDAFNPSGKRPCNHGRGPT